MDIKFRLASMEDVQQIITIIEQAKKFIKTLNIDQWQGGYPNTESIINDINNKMSYVAIVNNQVVATMAFNCEVEETYNVIDGNWLTDGDYGVIHRIAVSDDYRGKNITEYLFNQAEKICLNSDIHSLKIDTHKGNIVMQKFLAKHGFNYCGTIQIDCPGDTLRYAYEKII